MAGTSPRLSGTVLADTVCCSYEGELIVVDRDGWRRLEKGGEVTAVHEIGAYQPGEGERAVDGLLDGLGETEQQEGDQGDGDLDAHGILGGAEETRDLQGLLDPAKEQLDRPPPLVEIGDRLAAACRDRRSFGRGRRDRW